MDWQPIETAPRNGTLIDIWCSFIDHSGKINSTPDGRFPDMVWSEKKRAWIDNNNFHLHEEVRELPPKECSKMIATHWMPRPGPPKMR